MSTFTHWAGGAAWMPRKGKQRPGQSSDWPEQGRMPIDFGRSAFARSPFEAPITFAQFTALEKPATVLGSIRHILVETIMNSSTCLAAASILFLAGGCASITQSELQRVSVTASQDGKPLQNADCALSNDKGTWAVKAPGQVDVHKSGENLSVVCKKEGLVDGLLSAVSRAAGSMFGNIIFGGGIGALIDHNKGTGYDYPNSLPVQMGKSVTVDKRDEVVITQQASNCQTGQTC